MAPKDSEQDPSIEEILASIRQIISDDDEQPAEVAAPAPVKSDKLPPMREMKETPQEKGKDDDILNLTDAMKDESEDTTDFAAALNAIAGDRKDDVDEVDLDKIFGDEPPQPFQDYEIGFDEQKRAEAASTTSARADALDEFLTDIANEETDTVSASPNEDADEIFSDKVADATVDAFSRLTENVLLTRKPIQDGALTLEEIVKDLMRPMLRQWINENVPHIVESLVEKELEKLARRARDE